MCDFMHLCLLLQKGAGMSDLRIDNLLNTPSISAARRPEPMQKPPIPKPESDTSKVTEDSEDVKASEYGPVIASSSDGDTVRVKSESENEKEESKIYDAAAATTEKSKETPEVPDVELPPPPPPKPKFEPPVKEAAEAESSNASKPSSRDPSLASLSKSQLEQMYLQGDISQVKYNLELEAREAAKEEREKDAQNEETKEFINDMADSASKQSEIAQTAANIDTIENGDTSDTIPVDVRMQAMQAIDNIFQ